MRDGEDEGGRPQLPLRPPARNLSAGVSRRVAKGTLGAVPVAGAILSEVADALLPDPAEIERGQWEEAVSNGVNDAHARLDQIDGTASATETITGLAAQVIKALIESCPDGLHRTWVDAPDMAAELGVSEADLSEAIGELQMFGLVERRSLTNAPLRVRLTAGAYRQLDRQIMDWDTLGDARHVATLMLGTGKSISIAPLHQATGWEKRRFNPAFAEVLALVVDGPVSKEVQPDYPTRYLGLSAADRARLRRFVGA